MTDRTRKYTGDLDALARMARETKGATAIEYALIAGGISIAIVATVEGVGSEVVVLFTTVAGLF